MDKCYEVIFSEPTEKRYVIASSPGLAVIYAERWATETWNRCESPTNIRLLGFSCMPAKSTTENKT